MSQEREPGNDTPGAPSDVLVVGAGSAGCLIAERLSRDPARRVTVLEAGSRRPPWMARIPAAFPSLLGGRTDWSFVSEPQAGLDGRRDRWPRGRVVGGSSAINAMIYARGHPRDYDAWANDGVEGWGAAEIWPRFRELEDHALGPSDRHGSGGPVRVEALRDPNPLVDAFVAAGEALGWPADPDVGSSAAGPGDGLGFGPLHVTQRRGARHSAADAFLADAAGRPNLRLVDGAWVHRLELRGDRAVGAVGERHGRRTVWSAGEVVLCAGAVQSPAILQRSGIGPATMLERAGVRVRHDLPGVGANLWDHLAVPWVARVDAARTLDGADTLWNLLRWLVVRRGPLSSNVAEAAAFVRSDGARSGPADLQLHFGPAFFVRHGELRRRTPHLTIGPTLLTPTSRGSVTIRSGAADVPPRIDSRALQDSSDVARLVAGLELARELIAASPLARYVRHEVDLDAAAGGGSPPVGAAPDLEARVRGWAQTLYHPAGTCALGRPDDPAAVVGPDLRVRGLHGLRVVDASILTHPIRGNTNAPTMAVAAHAADRMLGDGRRDAADAAPPAPGREQERA